MKKSLRALLGELQPVRVMGAHDGMTAVLAQNYGFEAIWAGGLGICTAAGVPDAGLLTMTELLDAAVTMRRRVDIPIIADVDSGFGDVNVVRRMVQLYEGEGIAAICMEDKQYPKRNSFRDGNVLEDAGVFARKIAVAKAAQRGDDFMVIARLESLIVSAGLDDAIKRAEVYCEAGADALLIHSRARTADEVAEFATAARAADITVPLFMIPTTYPGASARELRACGADAVVYANQVIRAALQAMTAVLDHVAQQDSTRLIEGDIATVADLFDLVKTDELLDDSPWIGLAEKAGSPA
ncbi:isocitrate lyase/phosphoenolpyruvate mutase family protein [Micromonospora sp. STR1_7]|uniref:Isocitrate lyase/phosphoenolpyruvate mutase family protein n=1 Tax=Micromonospora parastrephiae TaxID=2806101 RepID=A0ABS1XN73_9ACTN|nr:isocitrate lyase/phosphoenolpyruvate mutase family protein [Micromonospora parastrephiae]MBM0230714.1 isocitrate lyase/phosphoenolpyruvate mutase family protein [Micromonospora parastrephiae]